MVLPVFPRPIIFYIGMIVWQRCFLGSSRLMTVLPVWGPGREILFPEVTMIKDGNYIKHIFKDFMYLF